MSRALATRTLTITCTRASFESGDLVQCESSVEVPVHMISRGSLPTYAYPGSAPEWELGDLPTHCAHDPTPFRYTLVEYQELERRAEAALDRLDPMEGF